MSNSSPSLPVEYVETRARLEYAIAERERQWSTSGSIQDAKMERVTREKVVPARVALDSYVSDLHAENERLRAALRKIVEQDGDPDPYDSAADIARTALAHATGVTP